MTKLQTKSIKHTFKRDGRFYFSRRIPTDLADHYRVPRIVCALGTSCPSAARKQVAAAIAELDAYWATLRLTRMTAIGHNFRVENYGAPYQALSPHLVALEAEASITMKEARDLYLHHKSKGRSPTFKNAAERTTAYLIAACDDKPLNRYSRSDALLFRDHLVERGLSGSSITRNLSHINAIINFAISENAIEMKNPFSGVYYDREAGVVERQPIPVESIRRVQAECRAIDDDMRWLIALVSDTGMRLAEAAGLAKADLLDLYGEHPHIHVRKYPWPVFPK